MHSGPLLATAINATHQADSGITYLLAERAAALINCRSFMRCRHTRTHYVARIEGAAEVGRQQAPRHAFLQDLMEKMQLSSQCCFADQAKLEIPCLLASEPRPGEPTEFVFGTAAP